MHESDFIVTDRSLIVGGYHARRPIHTGRQPRQWRGQDFSWGREKGGGGWGGGGGVGAGADSTRLFVNGVGGGGGGGGLLC